MGEGPPGALVLPSHGIKCRPQLPTQCLLPDKSRAESQGGAWGFLQLIVLANMLSWVLTVEVLSSRHGWSCGWLLCAQDRTCQLILWQMTNGRMTLASGPEGQSWRKWARPLRRVARHSQEGECTVIGYQSWRGSHLDEEQVHKQAWDGRTEWWEGACWRRGNLDAWPTVAPLGMQGSQTLELSIWKRLLVLTAWLHLQWGLLGKAAREPQAAEFWFKMKVNDI